MSALTSEAIQYSRTLREKMVKAATNWFNDTVEIGEFLLKMKKQLPHGQYTKALAEAGMSEFQAPKYTAIALQKDALPKLVSRPSLTQNLKDYAKIANAYKRGGEELADEVIDKMVAPKIPREKVIDVEVEEVADASDTFMEWADRINSELTEGLIDSYADEIDNLKYAIKETRGLLDYLNETLEALHTTLDRKVSDSARRKDEMMQEMFGTKEQSDKELIEAVMDKKGMDKETFTKKFGALEIERELDIKGQAVQKYRRATQCGRTPKPFTKTTRNKLIKELR